MSAAEYMYILYDANIWYYSVACDSIHLLSVCCNVEVLCWKLNYVVNNLLYKLHLLLYVALIVPSCTENTRSYVE